MESYTAVHDGFELELRLVSLSLLRIHEETVQALLNKLLESVKHEQVLKDPPIVEKEDYVVLDGMHRVDVLKRLGCNFAPACLVDYSSEKIRVGRWCRFAKPSTSISLVEKVVALATKRGYAVQAVSMSQEAEELGSKTRSIVVGSMNKWYVINVGADSALETYAALSLLEKDLHSYGVSITYESDDAISRFLAGKENVVIKGPILSKREIVETAKSGKVFPPKTTRHILPLRPLNAETPLSWLTSDEANIDASNKTFIEDLRSRRARLMPPGQTFGGRLYPEALLVFDDGVG